MNNNNKDYGFSSLPSWLQELWKIKPELARVAERDYLTKRDINFDRLFELVSEFAASKDDNTLQQSVTELLLSVNNLKTSINNHITNNNIKQQYGDKTISNNIYEVKESFAECFVNLLCCATSFPLSKKDLIMESINLIEHKRLKI